MINSIAILLLTQPPAVVVQLSVVDTLGIEQAQTLQEPPKVLVFIAVSIVLHMNSIVFSQQLLLQVLLIVIKGLDCMILTTVSLLDMKELVLVSH